MFRVLSQFVDAIVYRPSKSAYRLVTRAVSVWHREGVGGLLLRLRDRAHIVTVTRPSARTISPIYDRLMETATGQRTEEYIPASQDSVASSHFPVKLVAFYLPQFHPIPENDTWWGKGFTDWANVAKAVPQFEGHYQPHHPGELGFYDLRLADVQKQQIELARRYGIHGFAFYYYWFQGKRLLEKPLDLFLASGEDFPFCICWANENWTRRWDGNEQDVLIAQKHSPAGDLRFIEDISPILKDPRYIRIGGRPLIIVYRALLMPEPTQTAKRWREYCQKNEIGDPYLVIIQGYGFNNPREVGFDAAIEFPPHNHRFHEINHGLRIVNPDYQGKIHSYYEAILRFGSRELPPYKLFRGIFPNWDNEARRPGHGVSFAFSTPYAYEHWLRLISCQTIEREPDPEKRLVFINAWNEWAEAAHLEPDRKYGYAYLQATRNVLASLSDTRNQSDQETQLFDRTIQKKHDTAVFLHLFYPDLWDELQTYLSNLENDFDLFVSIPDQVKMDTTRIRQFHTDTYIYRCENRGRDIAPFLHMLRVTAPHQYPLALKLHTKKSAHIENGAEWRTDLYAKLIGSAEGIRKIKKTLHADTSNLISLIAPEGHIISSDPYLASNKEKIEHLARRANIPYFGEEFRFCAGSMFWFRPDTFLPLALLPVSTQDFEPEEGQLDGTLAHAVERFIGLISERMGQQPYETDGRNLKELGAEKRVTYRFAPWKK